MLSYHEILSFWLLKLQTPGHRLKQFVIFWYMYDHPQSFIWDILIFFRAETNLGSLQSDSGTVYMKCRWTTFLEDFCGN